MIFNEKNCTLCPRRCGANRKAGQGRCGAADRIKIAAAMPHMWEEPCISGKNGSGTIFFSGCQLGCIFCQNRKISHENFGLETNPRRFAEICFELAEKGVHNISLVSADQYLPYILPSLEAVKKTLSIPIVYNCSGYETEDMILALDGVVDIFLPDLKFFSSKLSHTLAGAENYFEVASKAIIKMAEQSGEYVIDKDGIMKSGTIVRHLVIPGCRKDSLELVKWLGESFTKGDILVSLMSQYTPMGVEGAPERRLTAFEYESVCRALESTGLSGYFQSRAGASVDYIPDFHLQGVTKT